MNVCIRDALAGFTASPARRTSESPARASPHTTLSFTAWAIAFTDSKSPSLAAGKPASMTSTRMRSSCFPMRSFSSRVIEAPGLCSPSRMVVSNMIKRSVMSVSTSDLHLRPEPDIRRAQLGCLEIFGFDQQTRKLLGVERVVSARGAVAGLAAEGWQ